MSLDSATTIEGDYDYVSVGAETACCVSVNRMTGHPSLLQVRQLMTTKALRTRRPEEVLPGISLADDDDLLLSVGDSAKAVLTRSDLQNGLGSECSRRDDFRVRGLSGVRVVEASFKPKFADCNTASPVRVIAEKAADMILQSAKQLLPG